MNDEFFKFKRLIHHLAYFIFLLHQEWCEQQLNGTKVQRFIQMHQQECLIVVKSKGTDDSLNVPSALFRAK